MADSLLTALCSICHVSAPQYRCPRCSVRTCSLACVKRHKAWSQCSGERDATAYVPRSRLRTAAGVDHDYNFLRGIELAAERAERVLVGERGIVQVDELRPVTAQEVRWRTGRDGRRKKVLVTRVVREGKGRVVERHLAARLGGLNIEMVCAPMGMARQRENHTTLNRRTGRINWQVEWLTWGSAGGDAQQATATTTTTTTTTRVLSKAMDDVPLSRAYHGMLEEQERAAAGGARVAKRVVRPVAQSAADATWQCSLETLQDPGSGRWVMASHGAASVEVWPEEKARVERGAFEYYLLGRRTTGAGQGQVVTRVGAGESLREILADTRVLEFPTIHVLRAGEGLPAGFVLGPKDSVPVKAGQGVKREGDWSGKNGGGRSAKRRPGVVQDGEGVGREEQDGDDCGGGEEDGGRKGGGVLEAGEVIAEQELMGDDDEDDETTSSSGSDSDE